MAAMLFVGGWALSKASKLFQASPEPELQPMDLAMATTIARGEAATTAAPKAKAPAPHHKASVTDRHQQPKPKQGQKAKIRNSLVIPEALKSFWYPVVFTRDLNKDSLFPVELFGEDWVIFRGKDGRASCIKDQCAHRACPLSLGSVENGVVACPYHGWKFDSDGSCTDMPSTPYNPNISVDSLNVKEGDGFVWIWAGHDEPDAELPTWTRPPKGYTIHCEQVFEVPTEHGLLLENLLDLAHAPFTHTSTFAKGWPIPESVKFRMHEALGGNWDPYPIDMSFAPPCGVLSTIGVNKPGDIKRGMRSDDCERHLWQLHVCLPSSEGKTRLMYRLGLDFWEFTKYVPYIEKFWQSVADQVLSEDLKLIQGQQYGMEKGADVWANPVSYDKLAIRYRRWRNSMEDRDLEAQAKIEEELRKPFSAGELFTETTHTDGRL